MTEDEQQPRAEEREPGESLDEESWKRVDDALAGDPDVNWEDGDADDEE